MQNMFRDLLILHVCAAFHCGGVALAQEIPSYAMPKFDTSASHRHNFCDIQPLLANRAIRMEGALRGRNVSIITTDYRGISEEEENLFRLNERGQLRRGDPGLIAVLLDELAERAGFEWRNTFAVVNPLIAETDGNKTWTDLLQWQTDHFDVAADYWAKTVERINLGLMFPQGWHDASPILVESANIVEEPFDMWSFLQPFEMKVWLLIAASIIVTGLLYFLLEKIDDDSDARKLDDKPLGAIFLSAITFTQHFEFRPNSNAAQLLSFSWTFWALVTASSYTANLASFLVSRQSVEFKATTLAQAAQRNIPICVKRSSNQDTFVSKHHPSATIIRKGQHDETFASLKTGECQVALTTRSTFDIFQRNAAVNDDCNLQWTGYTEAYFSSGFAVAFDSGTLCTSIVSNVLDLHLLRMSADGFIEKAWKNYLEARTEHSCSTTIDATADDNDADSGSYRLSVKDMGGIFIFHFALCVVSYCIAGFHYYQKKRRIRKNANINGIEPDGEADDDEMPAEPEGENIWRKRRPKHRGSMWESGGAIIQHDRDSIHRVGKTAG